MRASLKKRLAALAGLILLNACSSGSCGGGGMGASDPYPTPPPGGGNTVTNSGNSFSPGALSVAPGTAVTFNLAAGHTVRIDDGTGSGTCSPTNYTSFPVSHTFNGAAGTVFRIHCDFHSCGTTCPLSCSGMVMTVTLQ